MSEPMKKQTMEHFAGIHVDLDSPEGTELMEALQKIAKLSGVPYFVTRPEGAGENELITIDQAFPDMGPKDALAGARLMAELTQARLAAMIGVHRHHISEMETGKRKITPETAKRLAKALNTSYKIFL